MNMKMLCVAALALSAGTSFGAIYADATGDIAVPNPNLDISGVTVTNTATSLTFSIQVTDNVAATNWGKYLIFIDTNGNASGRADNPWTRPINTNGRLNDIYIGSWIDGGGGTQLWKDIGGWVQTDGGVPDLSQAAAGTTSITFSLAQLGLVPGQTIFFDVATSGGGSGDPGIDHLSVAGQATSGWGNPSTAGAYASYTLVPSPGSFGLLALGGLAALRRRR